MITGMVTWTCEACGATESHSVEHGESAYPQTFVRHGLLDGDNLHCRSCFDEIERVWRKAHPGVVAMG
jgi:hypothetical protein